MGESGLESNGNEGVLHSPLSSIITGTSQSDCLGSYPGHSLGEGGSYPSAEVQLVYSTAPAEWARQDNTPTNQTEEFIYISDDK